MGAERGRRLGDLQALLEARGVRPRRHRGQCFLVDGNLVGAIVREAALPPGAAVLEIGAGTGLLTEALREAGADVIACEIEPGLAAHLQERFGGDPGVRVVPGDAFEGEGWAPALAEAIRGASGAVRLVANLSYAVATKAVLTFLEDPATEVGTSLVMLQREHAERLRACPGTRAYGAASVRLQALARASVRRTVPPDVFWPRPRIRSALVSIEPRPDRESRLRGPAFAVFRELVRACFCHRRKTLGAVLRMLRAAPFARAAAALRIGGQRVDAIPSETWWDLAGRAVRPP